LGFAPLVACTEPVEVPRKSGKEENYCPFLNGKKERKPSAHEHKKIIC
jgi:hypothetical protein